MSQLTRDGFLYLSFLLLITALVGFLKLLDQANKKRKYMDGIQLKLDSETKILNKISTVNDMHREIIHDLKSPLMALEFSLAKIDKPDLVEAALTRLKLILSRMNGQNIQKNFDWYSIGALSNIVLKILDEKGLSRANFNALQGNLEVYFDALDIEVCFSELLDNAIKYGTNKDTVLISILEHESYVLLVVQNHLREAISNKDALIQKGVSKSGSGLGLVSVKNKIEEMGGLLSVISESGIFKASLKLRKR